MNTPDTQRGAASVRHADTAALTQAEVLKRLLALSSRLREYLLRKIPPRFANDIDADDVLQEVRISVLSAFPGCAFETVDAFDRWVFTVARHQLIDEVRAQRTLKRGGGTMVIHEGTFDAEESVARFLSSLSTLTSTPSARSSSREAKEAVLAALQQLPQVQRSAILMHHFEGCSMAQIADALGLRFDQVRCQIYHGRCQLGRLLGRASWYFSDATSDEGATGMGRRLRERKDRA